MVGIRHEEPFTRECSEKHPCPECVAFENAQRDRKIQLEEEVVKLRTGLARLAFRLGLAEHVPGKPGREAPFEVLEASARTHERGWNALIGVMMDEAKPASAACAHCEFPDAHEG